MYIIYPSVVSLCKYFKVTGKQKCPTSLCLSSLCPGLPLGGQTSESGLLALERTYRFNNWPVQSTVSYRWASNSGPKFFHCCIVLKLHPGGQIE